MSPNPFRDRHTDEETWRAKEDVGVKDEEEKEDGWRCCGVQLISPLLIASHRTTLRSERYGEKKYF